MASPRRQFRSFVTLPRVIVAVLWLGSLAVALLAGAYAYKYRAKIRAYVQSVQSSVMQTNLYTLTVRKVRIPAEGRDGGIAALGNGILFVNRLGQAWYLDSTKALAPLSLRVPVNVEAFLADPVNADVAFPDRFGVKDLLVQQRAAGVRILASFNWWEPENDCYRLRVAALETSEADVRGDRVSAEAWHTVFETTPCYPLSEMPSGGERHPTIGAGGRLVSLADSLVLLSVGGFKGEIEMDSPEVYWDPANSYGKTILIDLAAGTSRVYSVGHRNPQGLAAAPDGRIWLTEHAARGGDELNLVMDGANYGYPIWSYGTQYEQLVWPWSPRQGRHDGYTKPMFAWVPSLGISQLMVVERGAFPSWQGDLIVSSLAAQTLYRVRIEDGRTIFVEPIPITHRIRDIAEAADGAIVLKTDDNFLVYLEPLTAENAADLPPEARGQLVANTCLGCHTVTPDGVDAIGPNLWGVVGRAIGARDGYAYSAALAGMGGAWTEESLRAFITDPAGFAPGTSMIVTATYDERDLADLLAYLRSLR